MLRPRCHPRTYSSSRGTSEADGIARGGWDISPMSWLGLWYIPAPRISRHVRWAALGSLLVAACGPADGVRSSPLPSVDIILSRVASPDTVLGAVRDLGIGDAGYWIAAAGTIGLAYYDRDLETRFYPSLSAGPYQVRSALSLDVTESGHALVWDGILSRVVEVLPSGDVVPVVSGPDWDQMPQAPA